ncbi:MAG: hypothetical protein PF637_10340 [Spirochaetes bacterium]|jgi:hypothetical protein|nr:hypothetical protein [Spirochaetota bacterium]
MRVKRSTSIYFFIITALFIIFFFAVMFAPKEYDWNESYSYSEKKPYGCYALYAIMKENELQKNLGISQTSLYDDVKGFNVSYNDISKNNYIIITDKAGMDMYDSEVILSAIYRGANVLIAARSFQDNTIPTRLGFDIEARYLSNDGLGRLYHTGEKRYYDYSRPLRDSFISEFRDSISEILAVNETKEPVAVSIRYGKGRLILNTTPHIFTTYHLRENYRLPFLLLAQLPYRNTIWNEYYKPGTVNERNVLTFIDSNRLLSISFYSSLVFIVLFILFNAKRRQRIIPTVKPMTNSTLKFAESIAALYLIRGANRTIAKKLRQYFYSNFRHSIGQEDTVNSAESIAAICSAKCGLSYEETYKNISFIDSCCETDSTETSDLVKLHKTIRKLHN